MIVVDSSVWIANLRSLGTEPVRKLRSISDPDDILVGDLVLLEVLQGARDEAHAERIERHLRQFRIESMLDEQLAVRAARNYRSMRKLGVAVRKTVDLIIGTFCAERDHMLLHDDRDFDPMVQHLGVRLA
jgi:predicted nucleic acid-binding protein